MTTNVTDAEIEDFKGKWASEYAEWERIRDEVIAKDGECTAYHVTAEQARRMRERGETSVLLGPVAKALGLSPHVVLYPVADPPEVKISRVVKAFLRGRSVAELKAIRDACDEAIGAGNCWRMGCREPVVAGAAECGRHPLNDEQDGPASEPPALPAGGCFVPGCTGPCEGEPDRVLTPAPADAPVRCRIGWASDSRTASLTRWQCRSSGCGASGTVAGDRLVDGRGLSILKDDLPPQVHPYDPGETCLFDRARKP